MGYRSDVAFCISVDRYQQEDKTWVFDRAKFKEMVGFFKLTKFYEIAVSPEYDLIKSREPNLGWREGEIMFHVEQWKWYPDYDLVLAFDEMWKNMQDIEGISGYFMRVGEGDGDEPDVENDEFGSDPQYTYFGASTSMYFNDDETLGRTETDEEGQTKQAQTHTDAQSCGA
jgi:hypothetical protein